MENRTAIITFDVGNTSIKAGLFRKGRMVWAASAPDAEALAAKLQAIEKPEAAAACSVRPSEDEPLRQVVKRLFGLPLAFLGCDLPAGMPVLCDQPDNVGADRLANAIAAFHHALERVIVVDFGTAIAFDVVSEEGEFLGGAIAPGMGTCLDVLHTKTALLPSVRPDDPSTAVGKNTVDAILAGVVGGLPGLVDRVIENIEAELTSNFRVYATGTDAQLIAPKCNTVDEVLPLLTLHGVFLAWQRNANKAAEEEED